MPGAGLGVIVVGMEEPVLESGGIAVDGPPAKKNRPGTFGPGGKRVEVECLEDEDLTVPELLRDIRHVRARPGTEDKTPSRKNLRLMAKKDYKGFLALWKEEERLYASSLVPVVEKTAEEKVAADPGSVKAEALIEALLAEYEGGQ